jgi:hypothetical protein
MKQCPKCMWKSYCYTKPICDKARQILYDTDIANEIYTKYKKYECLYFINRKQTETTYTTIKEGETDYFQELINKYKETGCSIRTYLIRRGIKK